MVVEGFEADDPNFVQDRDTIIVAETGAFEKSEWFNRSGESSKAEIIYLRPTPQGGEASPGSGSETFITYMRQTNPDGQWSEWVVEEIDTGEEPPISEWTDEEPQLFCGMLINGFDFTYGGDETVNGIKTSKFTLVHNLGRWVHWISLEGRLVRTDWHRPGVPGSQGSVVRSTYSGWGEVNIIPPAPVDYSGP